MSRLLIADDEAQNLYMLKALLEGHGHHVIAASNGVEALAAARREPVEMIITDILMPQMDGFELCRQWKGDPELRGIPFVFYTATYTDPKDEALALSLGADRFVIKPAQPDELMAIIEETAAKFRAPDAPTPRAPSEDEAELGRQYESRLARKLEKKIEDLEHEIRERKRAEEENTRLEAQLRHAQKMEAVGRLAGGVAHDFNNILTAIMGNVEFALKSLRRPKGEIVAAITGLEQIEHSAQRAASLTRQLLVFSRRDVVATTAVDINAVLTNIEPMLRRVISEAITLQINRAPKLEEISADVGQVEQVVMNLVVNACDAMPGGGRLTLETTNVTLDESYAAAHPPAHAGPHVLLTVTDTGCGMSESTAARVFEPFFTTKPAEEGTGLGLSIIYGIVNKAGGYVTFDTATGRGTTFHVYFPTLASTQINAATREGSFGASAG